MKKLLIFIYNFVETLPDRFYPFAQEIEGKWVRGKQAYQKVVEDGFEIHGPGKVSFTIAIYRSAWHLVGSIISIICITLVAHRFLGSEAALYVLLGAAIIALCLQEFLLHPRRYGQSTRKGIFDVLTWVTPMVLYIAFLSL